MDIVVNIDGRLALPVWSLPYVTSWKLSPDMLLRRLVNLSYDYPRLPSAFTLDDNGKPSIIPPLHWGEIANEIRLLDNKLSDKEQSEYDDRKEWRKCSIDEIKQYKAYVWFDEFEKWFYRSDFCQESWIDEIDGTLKTQPVELCLNPLLPPKLEHFFENHKPKKLKPNAPLDERYGEIQDAQIIAIEAPTSSLKNFIDRLLVEETGSNAPLPIFYSLVEKYGLVVYDKVIEGQIVPSNELLDSLRQREQQDKSFDNYDFDFWGTLSKESKYSVFRDDVYSERSSFRF